MRTDSFLQVDGRVLATARSPHTYLILCPLYIPGLCGVLLLCADQCLWQLVNKMELRVPLCFLHITFAPTPHRTAPCVIESVTSEIPFQSRHLPLSLCVSVPSLWQNTQSHHQWKTKALTPQFQRIRSRSSPIVCGPMKGSVACWRKYVKKKNFSPHGCWQVKARPKEGPGSRGPLQGHTSNVLTSFHKAVPLKCSTISWALTRGLLGVILLPRLRQGLNFSGVTEWIGTCVWGSWED